jgi:hypothetical protein
MVSAPARRIAALYAIERGSVQQEGIEEFTNRSYSKLARSEKTGQVSTNVRAVHITPPLSH